MKTTSTILTILMSAFTFAQTVPDSLQTNPQNQQNTAQRILSNSANTKVTIGGYGEIYYEQPEGENGVLNAERVVLFLGYKFNDKTQFVTEIELEDAKKIELEQAFLQYSLNDNINLRGGLMLVPMGIINEYHEPTTFNGVQRPNMDKSIVPTTWREIGVGTSGKFNEVSLRYQAYIFNGFASIADGEALGGTNGLRNGRQEGADAIIGTPSFSAKLDYYGLPGLRLGLSGYFGKTQTEDALENINGSTVDISMIGLDARYAYQRFSARGQFIHSSISGTEDYNALYNADLGSALQGWYLEGAYNVLPLEKEQELIAFVRYEAYDTQASVAGGLVKNDTFDRNDWTFGLSYKIAPGAVVKADYQIKDDASAVKVPNQLNIGLGVWF
ncbi:porin [Yeosuana marina]|uniref:porin n=1 Tax=Yeosuana marina TaxID=1565536 RepID=UPI0030C8BFEB